MPFAETDRARLSWPSLLPLDGPGAVKAAGGVAIAGSGVVGSRPSDRPARRPLLASSRSFIDVTHRAAGADDVGQLRLWGCNGRGRGRRPDDERLGRPARQQRPPGCGCCAGAGGRPRRRRRHRRRREDGHRPRWQRRAGQHVESLVLDEGVDQRLWSPTIQWCEHELCFRQRRRRGRGEHEQPSATGHPAQPVAPGERQESEQRQRRGVCERQRPLCGRPLDGRARRDRAARP
jgi:hypothetical protein